MKAAGIALFLLFLSSSLAAHVLQVKVTVTQDTLAVGTNVTLLTGGVVLAEQKTGADGTALFNVSTGSYFVLLRRYPYPVHVTLLRVEADKSVTLSMSQAVSYSTAYGRIIGPADFSNATVTAYSGGTIARKASANVDGYYALPFLPEGNYDLEFSAPGFEPVKVRAFLPASESVEVNPQLGKPEVPAGPGPVLSSPSSAQQFSYVEARLTKGGEPLAGVKVLVATPSGELEAVSDSEGIVRVNAAEAGTYSFSYGGLSSSTRVAAAEKPPAPSQPSANETPPVQQPQGPQVPQQAAGASLIALSGFLLAGLALVAAAVAVAWWLLARQKGPQKGHPRAGKAQHGQRKE